MTGRPPFVPTDQQRQTVQVMRANGDAVSLIARNLGISEKTLRKCFKTELADGLAQVVASVGAAIVRAPLNGNVYAAKYWLSTHGGPEWRVVEGRQIGGLPDAAPIPVSAERRVIVYLPDNNRDAPKDR